MTNYPTHITVEKAFDLIESTTRSFGTEEISINDALGRIIAEDIYADRDFPPFNRVAMDGIAINSKTFLEGIRTYKVEGISAAGSPQLTLKDKSHCIEVMTGCILPENCDVVIRYEDIIIKENIATVNLDLVQSLQNIHQQGLDKPKGSLLVESGAIINPGLIAVAATVGKTTLVVSKNPKAIIISTGNELVDIDQKPLTHQIRKSNVYAVQSILKSQNITSDILHLDDDYEVILNKFNELLKGYDLIILSGGVSMGKYDYIPKVMESLGVCTLFHKVTERPGKPFWFGKHDKTTIFALPGNPISTTMCAVVYLRFWLSKSLGLQSNVVYAQLEDDVFFKPDLTYFLEVNIHYNKNGSVLATPRKGNGSGDLANLVKIDGFIELPKGKDKYLKDETYKVFTF